MSDVWSPPQAEIRDPGLLANADAIEMRNRYLSHEASVRSVGALYYLGGTGLVLGGLGGAVSGVQSGLGGGVLVFVFLAGLGALQFAIGRGLRGLKSWARIPSGIMSGIGLLGFPLGTLINGYILYLLFSAKGATVFSEEYQQVVADTPDIKYRTSLIVWILLGLVVLLVGLAVIVPMLSHR